MELIEPIEFINNRLVHEFGKWEDGRAKFRVVWSEDQLERVNTTMSPEGIEFAYPKVVERPKYGYIDAKYILEQLSVVPESDKEITTKLSYEPLWVFQNNAGEYLPPRWDACKLIVQTMYENVLNGGKAPKYNNDREKMKAIEDIDKTLEFLFGNETPISDALSYGWGVTVPSNYKKQEQT